MTIAISFRRYTPLLQTPSASCDGDKLIAGLVRTRALSEAAAFISGDKSSVFLVAMVASAATGSSLASVLLAESCAALLAANAPAPPHSTSSLAITSSSPLTPGAIVVVAKMAGEHQAQATLQAGAGADEAAHVFCKATMSYSS
jgi:hypothetical protein